jgi:nitronate monooxygenase
MMITTPLTEMLGIELPIIQAPMGGGPTTPELVAAVSNAGGLGSIAGGYLTATQLSAEIRAVREMTDRPFAVNVFAPQANQTTPEQIEQAQQLLEPYRVELGLAPRGKPVDTTADPFDAHLEVLLDAPPRLVSFTFGMLSTDALNSLHDAGSVLAGTATSVDEAVVLAEDGVDIICVQGAEAGAHRGSFLTDPERAMVGTLALTPVVVDAVTAPVVAAGGIMDGRGVAAVLALGAAGAQLGTAFLRCPEAGTTPVHRRALAEADEVSTIVTAGLTGRPARGIRNRLLSELHGKDVPAYPVMNFLTAELRKAAAKQGRTDLTSMWAGQGVALGREQPASELVRGIAQEAEQLIHRLAASCR